jgi:hypothetical protein
MPPYFPSPPNKLYIDFNVCQLIHEISGKTRNLESDEYFFRALYQNTCQDLGHTTTQE